MASRGVTRAVVGSLLVAGSSDAVTMRRSNWAPSDVEISKLKTAVTGQKAFQDKVVASCAVDTELGGKSQAVEKCQERVSDRLFCQLLQRSKAAENPEVKLHCQPGTDAASPVLSVPKKQEAPVAEEPAKAAPAEAKPEDAAVESDAPKLTGKLAELKTEIEADPNFEKKTQGLMQIMGCNSVKKVGNCDTYVKEAAFCLAFADKLSTIGKADGVEAESKYCKHIDEKLPGLAMVSLKTEGKKPKALVQTEVLTHHKAPEDDLAKEMTHDLEMNFNKIAPFGKEDTAKELQDHAAKTQDTLVDAVENAEVAEIKRAVFRALTRLRAATIKEFDTIARLETQAIDAYNDAHHYRAENPLAHLHEDEAPVETDKLKSFH